MSVAVIAIVAAMNSVIQPVTAITSKTSGVKTLALAKAPGDEFYGTDPQTVLSGKYPLSRYLYLYINKAPNRPVDPLVREFIKYVLSQSGQQIVVKDGYLPITSSIVDKELDKLR